MNTATATYPERINLRLHSDNKAILSAFILASALAHAEKTLQTHEVMRLNARDAAAFFAALDKPVQFNPALSAALAEHHERVSSL